MANTIYLSRDLVGVFGPQWIGTFDDAVEFGLILSDEMRKIGVGCRVKYTHSGLDFFNEDAIDVDECAFERALNTHCEQSPDAWKP